MNIAHQNSQSHPERSGLEQRILAAEQAVLERDLRLRRDGGVLLDRLRVQARRSGRIAAVGAILPFLLGWFMARSAPRSKQQRQEQVHHPSLAEAPWAGLVPLLWPLMPASWRNRVSPGVASFLTGIGLPLIAQRLSKRAAARAERAQRAQQGHSGAGPTDH